LREARIKRLKEVGNLSEEDMAEIKKNIEDDLFYFIQCPHCATIFLVEESISNDLHYGVDDENLTFKCSCPRCGTETSNLSSRRLKLKVEKVWPDREPSPLVSRLASKLKVEGIDY